MKRIATVLIAFILILSVYSTAFAYDIMPFANEYYAEASVAFTSSGKAAFSAQTTFVFSKLTVTSCSLEVKTNGVWKSAGTLAVPTAVSKDTTIFDAQMNYGSSCTAGKTYRVKATFNADGHTITKTSGAATYNPK